MPRTPADVTREALDHCIFALGVGAGMRVKAAAIQKLREVTRGSVAALKGFAYEIERPRDPSVPSMSEPGDDRWNPVARFILDCTETVGRLAANNALARGALVINEEDLKTAYTTVSQANSGGNTGNFCPGW